MSSKRIKKEWLSENRLEPYLTKTGGSTDKAFELYELDRHLSASLFHEIAFIEVALRNSVSGYLSSEYGDDWYCKLEMGFDKRVRDNITEAWNSLPTDFTKNTERSKRLGGRVIAASMFRTWTNILDTGGSTGLPAPFNNADHDRIWSRQALISVFPGANSVARKKDPEFSTHGLTRKWVHSKILEIKKIRNRVAHHESVVLRGIPVTGTDTRLRPRECHEACQDVAAMLDRDLASYLTENLPTTAILTELDTFYASLNNSNKS
ncbi:MULTISPECIES: Abi family protein [Corynebacterium]|jgi:hypothetical protein|uniref:Abortive infection bacteriophage resistance protein n=1 Tax=Corynebacterium segmentosum TaxID=43990 RepID=A0ABY6TFS3_9CORY|nr:MULTISPECIES: Abi family protein [Corynebacterium]ERS51681.1 hypothetical protein HMPREF1267_02232 [Corynebacterium sp. KPL1824]MDK4269131.1 Abi family protein [Corynebacterium accolens]MDK4280138.1 Abi family protein [Corynebacterium accolens]MDK4294396.1 Abi family protein [Corynebacterium accolens]MDK4332902.1 Abi family protein [Corynebacterium accolens]